MSDQIKGEVLVPQCRFLPKCECDTPKIVAWLESFGESWTVQIQIQCVNCGSVPYEQELPQGVEGIEHGKANP